MSVCGSVGNFVISYHHLHQGNQEYQHQGRARLTPTHKKRRTHTKLINIIQQ